MKITHKIDIHLDEYRPTPEIVVMQCDANTRELQFSLYANKAAWTIPEAAKLYVSYGKPDGTGGFYDTLPDKTDACTAEGNTVTAVLAEQVLTVPGKVHVAVSIQEGEQILATFAVQLNVKAKPGVAAIQSENYFCLKALIDAATVAAQKPVQVITVSKETDGSYKSSHNLSGIRTILDLQLPVACHWEEKGIVARLSSSQRNGPHTFTAVSGSVEYTITIQADATVICAMTELAKADDIPAKTSELENDSGFLTSEMVTVTKQEDGTFASDKTVAELRAAQNAGETLYCWCYDDDVYLPFTAGHGGFAFSAVVNHFIYHVNIYSGVNLATQVGFTKTDLSAETSDGITPHIGENGNWWIGEEDTGVSAGATDEQVEGAVEAYMNDNPLVKTVNGIEPDESGNVTLAIGGDGDSGGAFHFALTLEEDVSRVVLKLPVKWGKIVQFNLNCIPILSGETNVEMYNGGWNYKALGTCSSETKAINLYGVHYQSEDERRLFTSGLAIASNAADCCWPTLPQSHFGVQPDCEEIIIYTKAEGVVFQVGTKFDMWGVYTA